MKYPLYIYSIWYIHDIYTLQYQLRMWWTNARNLLEGVWTTHRYNSINCSAAVWLLTDLVSLYLFLFSNVATSLHKSHPYWWAVCMQEGCETLTVESMHSGMMQENFYTLLTQRSSQSWVCRKDLASGVIWHTTGLEDGSICGAWNKPVPNGKKKIKINWHRKCIKLRLHSTSKKNTFVLKSAWLVTGEVVRGGTSLTSSTVR